MWRAGWQLLVAGAAHASSRSPVTAGWVCMAPCVESVVGQACSRGAVLVACSCGGPGRSASCGARAVLAAVLEQASVNDVTATVPKAQASQPLVAVAVAVLCQACSICHWIR